MNAPVDYASLAHGRGLDVIGDVHGHASRLRALLRKLGYREQGGVYRHPERIAVFIGDLIDRGPEQIEAVTIARRMVDAGSAIVLMGNHEYNAIGYGKIASDGQHLRPRIEHNEILHRAFLSETGLDTDLHRELVEWFTNLPTHLTLGQFRLAHACWDPEQVLILGDETSGHLNPDRIEDYFRNGSVELNASEIVLKGPEARLPSGVIYRDNYGIARDAVRLAWWRRDAVTMMEMAIAEGEATDALAGLPAPLAWTSRKPGPLTFVGHYWMKGTPTPISEDVACVDFSVAKGGVLTAYRLDPDDAVIHPDRFVWV